MKTKFISFCAAAIFLATATHAQRPTAQIRGGLNLANISVNDDGDADEANQLASYQVGIVGDIPLVGMLHLQPGIIFTGKGAKVERGTEGAANYYKATTSPKYIEIPATAMLKIPIGGNSSFNAGFGPYLGIGVGGKRKIETSFGSAESEIKFSDDDPTTFDNEEGTGFGVMRRFDYGFNTSVGIEGKALVLSANYGYGLAKLQSGTNNGADNNNKHRVLSFTLGFKL